MVVSALGKFRIIDLSTEIAGPYAGRLFADYGSDVIKVEPAGGGDPARQMGPFYQDDPHPEKCLLFLCLNCNKRGVTLNLETDAGRRILRDLVKTADVLLESFTPGYLDSLGLGYDALSEINPGLVLTSVTPFGQTGPYRDYVGNDLVYQAAGGMMYTSGAHHREPLKHGHPQSLYLGGITAAYATSIALYARDVIGHGQHLDVSLAETAAAHHYQPVIRYTFLGAVDRRAPKADTNNLKSAGWQGIVPTGDGFISPTLRPPRRALSGAEAWKEYANLIGRPEIGDALAEAKTSQERDSVLMPALKEVGKFDYYHRIMSNEWLGGVVQTSEDLVNCPQLEERGFWTEVDHPVMGKVRLPGELFRMPESPWSMRYPAPLLGQHNAAVYSGELGYDKEELIKLRQQGAI